MAADRLGHVHGLGGQLPGLFLSLELDLFSAVSAAEVGAELAHELARFLLLVGRQRPNGLAGLGQDGVASGILATDGFQFVQIRCGLDLLDAFLDCGTD